MATLVDHPLHCRETQAPSISPSARRVLRSCSGLAPARRRRCSRGHLACSASSLVSNPQGSVVCLGEGLFDCLAKERGVPKEQVTAWTPYPGGAPANVACAVAKLGAKVAFLSALGKDELGDKMVDLLVGLGVDVSAVQRIDRPTRDVLVVYDANDDRQFVGFGGPNEGFADCAIEAASLPLDAVRNAGALVTGTLGLAFPTTADAMHSAVAAARDGPCTVLVDLNWRPVFWREPENARESIAPYLAAADIVKLSDEEAEWLLGIAPADALAQPAKVLEGLGGRVAGVLVTAGAGGSSYAFQGPGKQGLTGRVPVLAVTSADATGAGDAYLGGFLYSMVQAGGLEALQSNADTLENAVRFATACGAFATTKPGAINAQPSRQQALDLLKTAPPVSEE